MSRPCVVAAVVRVAVVSRRGRVASRSSRVAVVSRRGRCLSSRPWFAVRGRVSVVAAVVRGSRRVRRANSRQTLRAAVQPLLTQVSRRSAGPRASSSRRRRTDSRSPNCSIRICPASANVTLLSEVGNICFFFLSTAFSTGGSRLTERATTRDIGEKWCS
jgi:hypothetical protein